MHAMRPNSGVPVVEVQWIKVTGTLALNPERQTARKSKTNKSSESAEIRSNYSEFRGHDNAYSRPEGRSLLGAWL